MGIYYSLPYQMYAGRIPALQKSNVNINPNMTKEQMNAGIPRNIQWKGWFAERLKNYFDSDFFSFSSF